MIRRILCLVMGLLLTAGPALAQKPYKEPSYSNKERSTIVQWGIGAAFLIGCLVVAFKPSKRSNLK
jgi:hypothetical protein